MHLQHLISAFNEAVFDTDRERALRLVREAVAAGIPPEVVVFEAVIPALEHRAPPAGGAVELSLAQHFMTSQIAADVTEELVPMFHRPPEIIGRVVIGNCRGDLHTLGKRIVMGCLRAHMIECHDLGVNVAPERFVDEAVARGAGVIGISAMMVHTARGPNGCLKVREILRQRALEERIKIVVGGAAFRFDPHLYRAVHADAWAADAVGAVPVITKLLQETPP